MTARDIAEERPTKEGLEPLAAESRGREGLFAGRDLGFQEVQRLSRTGSFFWQLSPEEITWSDETYRIYEYSSQIRPTMEMARLRVHPDDLASFAATALRSKQEGKDFEFEHRLLMPDRSVKNLRVVARAATDESGKLVGYVGAVMDVTPQRLGQTALENALKEVQAARDQFQLAIDAIPGLVWSSLPDGHIDFLNQRWREYTGLTLEQARGWGWRAAIHQEDLPSLESYWRSVLASGQPGEKEARLRRRDGVYRWFLFRGVPLYDEAGTLVKWYGQTTDIDDRKHAEEQVRRSEAYLAEAQRLSQTGSFGWTVATGQLFWSAETYCILGYDQTAIPTLELVFNRVHPEDLALVRQSVERASRGGNSLDFEHRLLMPDGTVRHVHVVAGPAKDVSGQLEFVGAVMDITDRKQAAEALRASEHLARGQLAALARTLDSLAQEFDPDKLPKHVVTTILTQMGAQSVTVWERNNDALELLGIADGAGFKTSIEAGYFGGSIPIYEDVLPLWSEALQSGLHFVIEDISQDPARVILADGRTAMWPTADLPAPFSNLKPHFIASDVRALLISPMMMAGQLAGIIGIRFTGTRIFGREEIELTKALAHQATLAIQLMRLSRQGRRAAVMAERNRVARDIHDTLAQGFTGVIVQLEAAADATARGLAREANAHVDRAMELARESLKEARRSMLALRPQALEQSDLCKALEALIRKMADGTSTQATLRVSGEPHRLPDDWEDNLLRIGQELLTNALRHARARTIVMDIAFAGHNVRLDFRDDGLGFDPAMRHDGFGLLGIRERVNDMGGKLTIDSALGVGTTVAIVLPHAGTELAWQA